MDSPEIGGQYIPFAGLAYPPSAPELIDVRHAKPAQIGLQNTTWAIPKSILLLCLGLYNIGSYCIKAS